MERRDKINLPKDFEDLRALEERDYYFNLELDRARVRMALEYVGIVPTKEFEDANYIKIEIFDFINDLAEELNDRELYTYKELEEIIHNSGIYDILLKDLKKEEDFLKPLPAGYNDIEPSYRTMSQEEIEEWMSEYISENIYTIVRDYEKEFREVYEDFVVQDKYYITAYEY